MSELLNALLHGAVYALTGGALLIAAYYVLDLLTPGHLAQLFSDHRVPVGSGAPAAVGDDPAHHQRAASHSAALVTAAWLVSTSLVVFTAIWTNGETSMGWALLWSISFGILGILLNVALFVIVEWLTPGSLQEAVCAPGPITPLAVVAAGIALSSAAIVCASIA